MFMNIKLFFGTLFFLNYSTCVKPSIIYSYFLLKDKKCMIPTLVELTP